MIRWMDHTADVQLEITGERLEDIFSEFVRGMRDLLVSGNVQDKMTQEVVLQDESPADLLVALGRRVLSFFYGSRWVPSRFDVQSAGLTHLEGSLWGEPWDPHRHVCLNEVKGVTYHALVLERADQGWRAVVTFDV
jgi:SHS2 domain-containing protein